MMEIGETVLAKLATRRIGKGRAKRQKKKLQDRSVTAVWVGQIGRTGEHVVIVPSGDAVRCRTVKRVPEEDRWRPDLILGIKGTPRVPAPSQKEPEKINPRLVDEEHPEARERKPREVKENVENREQSGADLPQPEARDPRAFEFKRFRITDRLLAKYGMHTEGECRGCNAKRNGRTYADPGGRMHSEECRRRIAEKMKQDDDDKNIAEQDDWKGISQRGQDKPETEAKKARCDDKGTCVENEPNQDVEVTAPDCPEEPPENPDGIPQLEEDLLDLFYDSDNDDDQDANADGTNEPDAKKQRVQNVNRKVAEGIVAHDVLHETEHETVKIEPPQYACDDTRGAGQRLHQHVNDSQLERLCAGRHGSPR